MQDSFLKNIDIELSNRALNDYIETGDTDIICPICHEKPVYREYRDINGILNRASVVCKCKHILNLEFYL